MHFALHCTFYLSVNVFSTKVLIGDTIFTSPNGDGAAILRGHPSHAKVSPLAVQRNYLHFSVILRPWVMVRPRESNLRPPALQSNALPTDPICILSSINWSQYTLFVCRSFQIQTWTFIFAIKALMLKDIFNYSCSFPKLFLPFDSQKLYKYNALKIGSFVKPTPAGTSSSVCRLIFVSSRISLL